MPCWVVGLPGELLEALDDWWAATIDASVISLPRSAGLFQLRWDGCQQGRVNGSKMDAEEQRNDSLAAEDTIEIYIPS